MLPLHYPAVGLLGFEPRSHGLRVRGFTVETIDPLVTPRHRPHLSPTLVSLRGFRETRSLPVYFRYCTLDRIRTCDTRFRGPVFSPLNYGGKSLESRAPVACRVPLRAS
jgi:hypothetical protein